MGQAMTIPIDKLFWNEETPLHDYSAVSLEPVRQSLKDGYLTRYPLTVLPVGDRYLIVDGIRRYLICKELGYNLIPCRIEAWPADPLSALKYIVQLNTTTVNPHPGRMGKAFDVIPDNQKADWILRIDEIATTSRDSEEHGHDPEVAPEHQ